MLTTNLAMETPMPARYAVPVPRRSDAIRGALQCAFAAPSDDREILLLLRRLDHVEYAKRRD